MVHTKMAAVTCKSTTHTLAILFTQATVKLVLLSLKLEKVNNNKDKNYHLNMQQPELSWQQKWRLSLQNLLRMLSFHKHAPNKMFFTLLLSPKQAVLCGTVV